MLQEGQDNAAHLTAIIFLNVDCHFLEAKSCVALLAYNFIMRKVLLVIDGITFSRGTFEFARRMNEHSKILSGFFDRYFR
jgi:hypothetical protein